MIKVGIVGSRSRDSHKDKRLIRTVLRRQLELGKELHLVSGGCYKGADRFAEELSRELNLGISIHRPNFDDISGEIPKWIYASRAFARNTLIAEECDILIATWDGKSGGTADTISKVEKLGKRIILL